MGSVLYTIRTGGALGHMFLHGFDTSTGKAKKIDIPQFEKFSGSFGTGAYALATKPNSTVIYALGPTGGKDNLSEHSLFAVDTVTKNIDLVGTTVAAEGISMHSTLDAEGGILYFQYQNGVGLAMKGISTTNASTTYDEPSLFYTFDFDPKTRLLFGIALTFDETEAVPHQIRSLGSLDVATGESKTLLNMSDYAENLAATAFDPQARTLSCMLLPQGQQSANLVTLNVDSATVVGEPNLCPRYDMCPRNLGLVGDSVH
jgi:hypothetical protein